VKAAWVGNGSAGRARRNRRPTIRRWCGRRAMSCPGLEQTKPLITMLISCRDAGDTSRRASGFLPGACGIVDSPAARPKRRAGRGQAVCASCAGRAVGAGRAAECG
jgi:hypothetical protein